MNRRMRLLAVTAVAGAALTLTAGGSSAAPEDLSAQGGVTFFRETLSGINENVSLSTTASGNFRATLDTRAQEIRWQLSYADLTGGVTMAHIHFGRPWQNGGISLWFCTNLGNGPVGTPLCPAAPATISGTFGPTDVAGPTGQGIAPGEFDELAKMIKAGHTYVNVHSVTFGPGEVRAQLDHH